MRTHDKNYRSPFLLSISQHICQNQFKLEKERIAFTLLLREPIPDWRVQEIIK
jgi:hypothetical protein